MICMSAYRNAPVISCTQHTCSSEEIILSGLYVVNSAACRPAQRTRVAVLDAAGPLFCNRRAPAESETEHGTDAGSVGCK